MNMEGEAASVVANQVIHIVVEGFEMILRLSGKGLKELSEMLYVAFKNHEGKDTPGKQKLAKILQTGTPRVFDLPREETKNFVKEAKRYGISYCVLKPSKLDEKAKLEVIVHQEDAERVSRIMNRVHTATVEMVPEKDAKGMPPTTGKDLLGSLFVDTQQKQPTQDGESAQGGIEENTFSDDQELAGSLFVDTQQKQPTQDGKPAQGGIEGDTLSDDQELAGSLLVDTQKEQKQPDESKENTSPATDLLGSLFVPPQQTEAPPPVKTVIEKPERTQPDFLDDLDLELFSEEGLENAAPQQPENPIPSRTQPNDHPSEHSSEKSNSSSEKNISKEERSSVREEIKEIKKELDTKKIPTLDNGREVPKMPVPKVSGKDR